MRLLPLAALVVLVLALVPVVDADTAIFYTTNATDGYVSRIVPNSTFSSLVNGAGTGVLLTADRDHGGYLWAGALPDEYQRLYRSVMIFDTSAIPDTATLNNAVITTERHSRSVDLGDTNVSLVSFTVDGTITADDFDNFGNSSLSEEIPLSTMLTGTTKNWALYPIGISNISKTSSTGFGFRLGWDKNNVSPTWKYKDSWWSYYTADSVVKTPYLEITYTVPDTTPPDSITALTSTSVSCNQLYFNWTNPADADYAGMMLYRNNTQLANLTASDTGVSWDGLPGGTAITFSSRTFDSTGNVNATWVNMTTTTASCASPTPTPTPSWQSCFQWCGIQEIFFWNASSDISGYRVMDHIPEISAEREVNVSVSSATGSKTIGSWASPSGSPGVTTIAPGLWRFRTYHSVSSQVGVTTLEFKVFNRSSDGTETDLFYGHAITEEINALSPTEYLLSYARRNATTLFTGDRLVIKVNASTSSVTARNAYMWLAGNTNTSMVQASNFICCSGSSDGCGVMVANELPLPFYIPISAAGLSFLAWRRKSRM